tara:strand:- start:2420 stop:5188 length:2769 start_codon:yes stop_codon:yes gene_type:complete
LRKTENNIEIGGAKNHNLKNVSVSIPRYKMTVVTGLSGSGKSSLVFDTLYAEGQRLYIESLSSYSRQFLERLNKPKVDFVKGVSPAIAIDQKVSSSNPRSTVGTKTEIYDYIRLLFARIGKTFSPISGRQVKSDSINDVVAKIESFQIGTKFLILSPCIVKDKIDSKKKIQTIEKQGFVRIYYENNIYRIDELDFIPEGKFYVVVDRLKFEKSDDFFQRIKDSIELSFYEGKGNCSLLILDKNQKIEFSNQFNLDGMSFIKPSIHFFSFNNPFGACQKCGGFGDVIGVDPELVIPDKSRSIYDGAIAPWRGTSMSRFQKKLINSSKDLKINIHKPFYKLSDREVNLIWNEENNFIGINKFFKKIESKLYKIQNRVMLSRYRGKTKCSECKGSRLRKETNYVKINNKNISDLLEMSIHDLKLFFDSIKLSKYESQLSNQVLKEINSRINFIFQMGIGYLSLNRRTNSLSGGESQRISLSTSLGSSLVGSMYILDEPSIGLHPRDNEKLISVMKQLRDIGNTLVVVEHDKGIISSADRIIDMGPFAGTEGGEIIAEGSLGEIIKSDTLTAKYLNGKMKIQVPGNRKKPSKWISIIGARENNLKDINVSFPLNCLTVVTGVSGSGKSTLVHDILYPIILRKLGIFKRKPGEHISINGDIDLIKNIEYINQNPIGRSSRSNPITYLKAYDDIRHLFANQKLSISRGYKPRHFSFNVEGGRCENCKGDGQIIIEMQFMADVVLECESCKGKRFNKEVLDIKFFGKNISDVLKTTVDDAINFFTCNNEIKIAERLKPLKDVGLGYVTLGQSSSTLSGGEAQRVKLASFIGKEIQRDNILFIFDEPTTGLHFHDINKLLKSFNLLIKKGHTIIVVEHNIDLIKCADYIIDLGPGGGEFGGNIVAEGTPEEITKNKKSFTAKYLLPSLKE